MGKNGVLYNKILAKADFFRYFQDMLESVKIYTSDVVWQHIFVNLGLGIADSQNVADVNFDEIGLDSPVSVNDLKKIIYDSLDNRNILTSVFGHYVVLPKLQHKIIVLLYKNPNITMRQLKDMLGIAPDITSHAVENAVYQLRKNYGHDFIQNTDGKYRIGHI